MKVICERGEVMSMKQYHLMDLKTLEDFSPDGFLCIYIGKQWDIAWISTILQDIIQHGNVKEIDIFAMATLRKACETQMKEVYLFDTWFHISHKKIQLENKEAMLIYLRNINDLMETKLASQVNKLRTEGIPCGLFCIRMQNGAFELLYTNSYIYQFLGYKKEELQLQDIIEEKIVDREDLIRIKKEITNYIQQESILFEVEYRVKRKDGKVRWMSARIVPDTIEHQYVAVAFDSTKMKQMMHDLRISEEEKKIALEQGNIVILRYDVKNKVLYYTNDGKKTTEPKKMMENIPQSAIEQHLIKEETQKEYLGFFSSMLEGKPKGEAVFLRRNSTSQKYIWIKGKFTMIYNEKSEPTTAIISYQDYSEAYERELAYERWKQDFERRKKDSIAYYEYDLTHDVFEKLEGALNDELPKNARNSFTYIAHYAAEHFVSPKDRKKYLKVFSREYLLDQYQKGRHHFTLQHRRIDSQGNEFWAYGEIQLVWDPYASLVRASVLLHDIDNEKKDKIRMKRLSETDALTGLYNRSTLFHRIESTLQHSGKHVLHVLVLIDLDNFKLLNDTYGHQYGDDVLINVAKSMRSACRSEDYCGRIGGDEFVIFLRNLSCDYDILPRIEAIRLAILNCMDDREIVASFGVACYPNDSHNVDELYRHSDEAMYRAKRSQKHKIQFYKKI